jgi:hypothetical protein
MVAHRTSAPQYQRRRWDSPASFLKDQAEYLNKLAECANPAEALKCQLDFAQQFWSRSIGEGSRVFDRLRTHS